MLVITLAVKAPIWSAQAVKEHLAMYMERFGDAKVLNVKEEFPQQMGFGDMGQKTGRKEIK